MSRDGPIVEMLCSHQPEDSKKIFFFSEVKKAGIMENALKSVAGAGSAAVITVSFIHPIDVLKQVY